MTNNLFYTNKNDIFMKSGDFLMEEPTVMFNIITGTLHSYGGYEDVKRLYDKWVARSINKDGIINISQIVLFKFDRNKASTSVIVEEMTKMTEIFGYCKLFYDKYLKGEQ